MVPLLACCSSLKAVMFCNKNINNRQKVICKLIAVQFMVTMNYNLDPSFCKNPLHKFEDKSTQSVLVGNHNLAEFSLVSVFQKGYKVWPLPVEAGSNVEKDFCIWVGDLEGFNLAGKVGCLFLGADLGVADHPDFLSFRLSLFFFPKDPRDIGHPVEPLPSWATAAIKLALFSPPLQSSNSDTVPGCNVVGGNESILFPIMYLVVHGCLAS